MSRDIPEPIKRAVRQNCGFGCVICGLPVFHYDHIDNFADVQGHAVENIVLLCPTHHQEKTSGRLAKGVVTEYAKEPINKSRDWTSKHGLRIAGTRSLFEVGSNEFEFDFQDVGGNFNAIRIFDQTVFGMSQQDGHLLMDAVVTDRRGETILRIASGEMQVSTSVWDYRLEGRRVLIRSAERQVELSVDFTGIGMRVNRGFFVGFQYPFHPPRWAAAKIEPTELVMYPGNNRLSGCKSCGCRNGVVVGL